jgi:uncharacterized phage infection (PIP) family protein YhgE
MEETFDELVTKHTRRELEEMALKYGVENLGGTKSQLADAILDAMKKHREVSKPAFQERPKEMALSEKPKAAEKRSPSGKKGVNAKAAAINGKAAEFQKAGRDIREEGIREMNKGVRELQSAADKMSREMKSDIHNMMEDGQQRFNAGQTQFRHDLEAQMKENKECAAKFNSGAGEIRSATTRMCRDFRKAGKSIRDDGFMNLQKGLNQFRSDVDAQVGENRQAISAINSAARELQGRAMSFHDEIHRYQEQDLKNYVRDFYYG